MEIMKKVEELLDQNNVTLAYLTKFGAHLYGTNTKTSDTDVKGLYWPNINDLILGKNKHSISFKTGDNTSKNNPDDIDIQLWSVGYWLSLVNKGDTNAIDLLFSMYSPSRLVSDDIVKNLLIEFYNNPIQLIDLKHTKGYVQYAYMQARKYGLRGSRIDILKKVLDFFQSKLNGNKEAQLYRIDQYFDELLSLYSDPSYLFEKKIDNQRCLYIIGKGYCGFIKLYEAINRLQTEYEKYGHRALLAADNEGIDWKAVSHAVRACYQMLELIENGFISYPLKSAPKILDIKLGNKDWLSEVEPLIASLLDEISNKLQSIDSNDNVESNSDKIVLNHYKVYLK